MKLLSFATLTTSALAASTVNLRVSQDATVSFNGIMCWNDTVPCSSIRMGLESTLMSFRGNRDYERALLGFNLPTNAPQKCVLHIPKPKELGSEGGYEVTVSSTDNVWQEDSVNGFTKRNYGKQIGKGKAASAQDTIAVDVTEACKQSKDYKLSLFVDTTGSMIRWNSLQSESSDVFTLDYTF